LDLVQGAQEPRLFVDEYNNTKVSPEGTHMTWAERVKHASFRMMIQNEPPERWYIDGEHYIKWLGYTNMFDKVYENRTLISMFTLFCQFGRGEAATAIKEAAIEYQTLDWIWWITILLYLSVIVMIMVGIGIAIIAFVCYTIYSIHDVKKNYLDTLKTAYLIQTGATVLGAIFSGFGWYNMTRSVGLQPQGFRETVNKSGMLMTGMISLLMLLCAPIIGAKKIGQLFKPILDLLKQLPYATWLVEWIRDWFKGEVEFDDLPENDGDEVRKRTKRAHEEYIDAMKQYDEESEDRQLNKKWAMWRATASNIIYIKPDDKDTVMIRKIRVKDTDKTGLTPVPMEQFKDFIECFEFNAGPVRLEIFSRGIVFETSGHLILYMGGEKLYTQRGFEDILIARKAKREETMRKAREYKEYTESIEVDPLLVPNPYLGRTIPKRENVIEKLPVIEDVTEEFQRREEVRKEVDQLLKELTATQNEEERLKKERLKQKEEMTDLTERIIETKAQLTELQGQCYEDNGVTFPCGKVECPDMTIYSTKMMAAGVKNMVDYTCQHIPVPDGLEANRKFEILEEFAGLEYDPPRTYYDNGKGKLGTKENKTPKSKKDDMSNPLFNEATDEVYDNWEKDDSLWLEDWQQWWSNSEWGPYIDEKFSTFITEPVESSYNWTKNKCKKYPKLAKAATCVALLAIAVGYGYVCQKEKKDYTYDEWRECEEQAKGKNKGGNQRGGRRKRANKRHYAHGASPGAEDFEHKEDPDDDYETYFDEHVGRKVFGKRGDRSNFRYVDGHAVGDLPSPPSLNEDSQIKRKIFASKKRSYKIHEQQYLDWLDASRIEYQRAVDAMRTLKLSKQAWNANDLANGVYKIYDHNNTYRCTGTLVANRMFVVLHALTEDFSKNYTARNHQNCLELKGITLAYHNDEIGSFFCNGVTTPFGKRKLKVMTMSEIVTVYGFGDGSSSTPDSISGFASPLGWCNAKTRQGDCTSPVLDRDGNIVGFWTHGNGVDFGRFEPVTEQLREQIGELNGVTHTGMDFRSLPRFQNFL
jgi:hypothetical protein